MPGRKRQQRRRKGPVPVYTAPVEIRPVNTLALNCEIRTATEGTVSVPVYVADRPWRVTSIDVTLLASSGATAVEIRLYGGVAGASAGLAEVTLQTRLIPVSQSAQQIKLRNSSKVQHCVASGRNIPLMRMNVLGTTGVQVLCIGIVHISVLGILTGGPFNDIAE